MKNNSSKVNNSDMQLHINKALEIIDNHIPTNYVEKVIAKLPIEYKKTRNVIFNLRHKKVTPLNHMLVFNALVEVAIENKEQKEELVKKIT